MKQRASRSEFHWACPSIWEGFSVNPQLLAMVMKEAAWRQREEELLAAEQRQRERADALQAAKDALQADKDMQQQHIDKLERSVLLHVNHTAL